MKRIKDLKSQRFEMLMTRTEKATLRTLSERKGVSQADIVRGMIRRAGVRLK